MVTPFKADGSVDYAEAVRLANHLADNGTDTVLLSGTTGESPTLTHEEEMILFREVKQGLGGKAKVMAGTGSNSTRTAVAMTKKAGELGLDGALLVVPYYNKPSQEGLYQHFKAVNDAADLPLVIYNIPGRTSRNMECETTLRLAELSNYVAVKEASGDLEQMKKIVAAAPRDFVLYSGDDNLTLDVLRLGGVGVVSVAAQLVGPQMKKMLDAYFAGDLETAEAMDKDLQDIFQVIFITTNPAPVKAALNMRGFHCGIPRLPLVDLTEDEREQVRQALIKHGLL
ncbi:4-hydroxy-tetrahydrodipicolinate synthase [Candidatus Termititenax persephonae]|uniref:4-hydroxy-tetrahydrodipicolinate synthase n=1 Tax=Candidatus Termititenax persephonae TaxID=2218525 RepID=A0A388THW9_9BACT|nr:4-hydroxy-tetrahydrodipicolinate synthase [Candidatus Termititenax persephonae]